MDIISTALYGFLFLFVLLGIGLIWFYFHLLKKYKYKVTIWKIANDGRKVKFCTRAMETDKKGIMGLKFLKHYKLIAPPPEPDAIEIDHKGFMNVECYLLNDQITYLKHDVKIEKDSKNNIRISGGNHDPISAADRISIFEQIKRKYEESKTAGKWLSENLPVIANATIIIAVVIGAFLIYSEYNDSKTEWYNSMERISSQNLKTSEQFNSAIEKLDRVINSADNKNSDQKPQPKTPPN